MKRKNLIVTALLVATMALAGCIGENADVSNQQANQLANSTGTEISSSNSVGSTYWLEMRATESNQKTLYKQTPIPNMDHSLERQNLIRRYKTLNDQNQEFHVYLMSHGRVVSYFVAKGKVSSVNSKLTNPEQLIPCPSGDSGEYDDGTYNDRDKGCVVTAPQLDGSYGTNGDAVFFYTTDGSYVEWNGVYLVSEEPRTITTPVSLEADVNVSE